MRLVTVELFILFCGIRIWNCAPGLLHAMNDDDADHLMEFCEWILHMYGERECFSGNIEHSRC